MSPEDRDELARVADQQRAKQAQEYAQYYAAGDISFNGVLAYPAGAPVPASNVERYGYDAAGLVVSAEQIAERRAQAAEAAKEAEKAAIEAHRAEVAAAGAEPVAPAVTYEDVPAEPVIVEDPPVKKPGK